MIRSTNCAQTVAVKHETLKIDELKTVEYLKMEFDNFRTLLTPFPAKMCFNLLLSDMNHLKAAKKESSNILNRD